jgi:cell division protein WhiA
VSFAERVREELARLPSEGDAELEAEGMLRTGGSLVRAGGSEGRGLGAVFRTSSGPAVRRLRELLKALGATPTIEVHRPTALQRGATYHLRVSAADATTLRRCGLLDSDGRPVPPVRPARTGPRRDVLAYLRGALLGGGSISDPRSAAHLEVPAPGEATARHLAGLLRTAGVRGARTGQHGDGWRVVAKSGQEIGALLAGLGAHTAFLEWDALRLRRELRGEANRVANADRANLARAVGAAARDVEVIGRFVTAHGWEALPEDVRPLALARVANPEATLAELGALLDPAVGKATVHRRLRALRTLAAQEPGGEARDT